MNGGIEAIMLEKILFWGILVFFSLFLICFLTLTIITIIHGDLKTITSDPTDPILEKEYGRYMEKEKYDQHLSVFGKIHLASVSCLLITFALYGLQWYIMKRSSSQHVPTKNSI